MSCSRSRRLGAVLLVLALAGCGELPRPFEHAGGPATDLLKRLQDSRGVTVAPVYDAPPAAAAPLAERMADAFRKQDIPATAKGVLGNGNLLEGWARLDGRAGDTADLAIDWRLTDPAGVELARVDTRRTVPLKDWEAGAPALLDRISAAAAPGLMKPLIGDPVTPVAPETKSVTIAVTGAPGDGNDALRRALYAVLRREGLPPAESAATATFRLGGTVTVAPDTAGEDKVRLVWTLRDAKDKELAVLKQENRVPTGRLSGRWGAMAFDVALAMRDGIVDSVRRLEGRGGTRLALPPTLR